MSPLRPRERGQASIEMLLALFIFIVLLFGALSFGQGFAVKHGLDVATEKAARLLSILPTDWIYAEALVRSEVDASVLGGSLGALVNFSVLDADTFALLSPDELAKAGFGYRFVVQTRVPFEAVVPLLNLPGRTITSSHIGIVDRAAP